MYDDFICFDGMETCIQLLYNALDDAEIAVNISSEQAAYEAAQIIQSEQRRLLSKANFSTSTTNLASLIEVKQIRTRIGTRTEVGYRSESIEEHPEILVIEFGRPGVVGAHTKKQNGGAKTITVKRGTTTYNRHLRSSALKFKNGKRVDSLGRIIGKFDKSISHIRAGYFLAVGKAAEYYNKKLYNIAAAEFRDE